MRINPVHHVFLIILFGLLISSCSHKNWRETSRKSAHIATPADQQKESIFQIYVARAFAWRGYFAVHPWVAWKKPQDKQYTVAQVTSWSLDRGQGAVGVYQDIPDRYWYDEKPWIIFTATGDKAEKIIAQAITLIENYPYTNEYGLFPGPNSNTFIDYLIRNIPELTVELPPHAIGKDYLVNSSLVDYSPSGKGFQVSLFGLLGFTVGIAEGVEINLFGLSFGLDFWRPAIKLPFIGRLGFKDAPL